MDFFLLELLLLYGIISRQGCQISRPKVPVTYGAQDSHRFGKAISLTLQKQARVLNSVPIMEERNGFDLITPHKRRR